MPLARPLAARIALGARWDARAADGCHRNCHRTSEHKPVSSRPATGSGLRKHQQNRTKQYVTALTRTAEVGFQDRCLKPLGHPSFLAISATYTSFRTARTANK